MFLATVAPAVTDTTIDPELSGAAVGILAGTFLLFIIIGAIIQIVWWVGLWLTAQKAGIFGLWAIIPVVQFFAFAKIAGKPLWWGFLCLIPLVNMIILIVLYIELTKKFGRGVGTTIGLIFLPFVFWPILGFGSAEYQN